MIQMCGKLQTLQWAAAQFNQNKTVHFLQPASVQWTMHNAILLLQVAGGHDDRRGGAVSHIPGD